MKMLLAVATVAVFVALAVTPFGDASEEAGQYRIDAQFQPTADGMYEFNAVVTDLVSEHVVMTPNIIAKVDQPAVAVSDSQDASGTITRSRLEVSLLSDHSAVLEFSRLVDGTVVSTHETVVRIAE